MVWCPDGSEACGASTGRPQSRHIRTEATSHEITRRHCRDHQDVITGKRQ
jgi:hypothetical protein